MTPNATTTTAYDSCHHHHNPVSDAKAASVPLVTIVMVVAVAVVAVVKETKTNLVVETQVKRVVVFTPGKDFFLFLSLSVLPSTGASLENGVSSVTRVVGQTYPSPVLA